MPLKKGAPRVDPMAVDSRGRILSYIGWSVTDRQPEFVSALTETPNDFEVSGILSLREEIRLFMKTNAGTPPAMLSKVSDYSDKSEFNERLTDRCPCQRPLGGHTQELIVVDQKNLRHASRRA